MTLEAALERRWHVVAVRVAVEATPAADAEPRVKEVLGATAAILTAAVTAALIKFGEGADENIGSLVKRAFRDRLRGCFEPGSEPSRAIANDLRNALRFRGEGRRGLAVTRSMGFVAVDLTVGS